MLTMKWCGQTGLEPQIIFPSTRLHHTHRAPFWYPFRSVHTPIDYLSIKDTLVSQSPSNSLLPYVHSVPICHTSVRHVWSPCHFLASHELGLDGGRYSSWGTTQEVGRYAPKQTKQGLTVLLSTSARNCQTEKPGTAPGRKRKPGHPVGSWLPLWLSPGASIHPLFSSCTAERCQDPEHPLVSGSPAF